MSAVLASAKFSVFYSKFNIPKSSQRFYLAQTLIKHKKQNQNRGYIIYLLLNRRKKARNKNKIGLPPNKRYLLAPLARHKSENRSKYCHNNKIDLENSFHIPYVQQQVFFEASKSNQKG